MIRPAVWQIVIGLLAMAWLGGRLAADEPTRAELQTVSPAGTADETGVEPASAIGPEDPPPTDATPPMQPGGETVPTGEPTPGEPGQSPDGLPLPTVEQVLAEGQPYTPVISSNCWFAPDRWYVNTDFVILNHNRAKRSTRLALDAASNEFFSEQNLTLGIIEGNRTTIGLWRCHDTYGWDHAVEFSFGGFENWHKQFEFIGIVPGAIFTFPNFRIGGFNGGDAAFIYYKSQLNSGGIDLRWTKRPGKDELVYDPDGYWKRQAESGSVFSFLLGIHDTEFDERFTYSVRRDNTPTSVFSGDYVNHTTNNIIGLHIGSELDYKHDLWYVGIRGGSTIGVNVAEVDANLSFNDPQLGSGSHHENGFNTGPAAVSDLSLLAGWQIKPNMKIHVSYDFIWLTSVATGPGQVRLGAFQPQAIDVSRDMMFTGASLGLEVNF